MYKMDTEKDLERAKRLNEVYKYLFVHSNINSKTNFADVLGVQRTGLSAAMNGSKANLTDNLFSKICSKFPIFNLNYLLTGIGQLLTIREEVANEELEKQFNPPQPTSYVDKLITSLEKQIKDKDDQLADKDRIIKLLEQKIEVLEAMQHIDSSNPLKDHPFTLGVADKGDQEFSRV